MQVKINYTIYKSKIDLLGAAAVFMSHHAAFEEYPFICRISGAWIHFQHIH